MDQRPNFDSGDISNYHTLSFNTICLWVQFDRYLSVLRAKVKSEHLEYSCVYPLPRVWVAWTTNQMTLDHHSQSTARRSLGYFWEWWRRDEVARVPILRIWLGRSTIWVVWLEVVPFGVRFIDLYHNNKGVTIDFIREMLQGRNLETFAGPDEHAF